MGGVVANLASERTNEGGIRMALGARPAGHILGSAMAEIETAVDSHKPGVSKSQGACPVDSARVLEGFHLERPGEQRTDNVRRLPMRNRPQGSTLRPDGFPAPGSAGYFETMLVFSLAMAGAFSIEVSTLGETSRSSATRPCSKRTTRLPLAALSLTL